MKIPTPFNRSWAGRTAAALAAWVGLATGWFQFGDGLRHLSYDYLFPFRRQVTPDNLVIVSIDDASHLALEQPSDKPWDRALHARLLDRLTRDGAKLVVFDILFEEERAPASDALLEEAIRANGKVVLAASLTEGPVHPGLTNSIQVLLPTKRFRQASASYGIVDLAPDSDYCVRRFHPGDWEADIPPLAWAAALVAGRPEAGRREFWQTPRLISYYGQPGSLAKVSLNQAIASEGLPPGFFRDKFVFVGAQQSAGYSGTLKESFATPWTRFSGRFTTGVELHATMFLNLLRGDSLRRLPVGLESCLLALLGAVAGFGLARWRALSATLVAVGAMVLVPIAGILLGWQLHTFFPWMIVALVQIPLALLTSVMFGVLNSLQEAQTMERLLALHLPASRARQLRQRPDLLKPNAEQMDLSIMFSDIANFSAVVQRKTPHDLVRLLSSYFESLIRSVHAENGTVVKLIGDSVFAVWNAPEPQPNHREQACRAALRLRDVLDEFDQKSQDLPLRTRIGVHTGPAYVGNFGSAERFDYTAIGDSVNLASRLEGLNEHLGTKILVSRDTLTDVEDKVISRLVGHFRLKGFDRVVEVHELLGAATGTNSTEAWTHTFRTALRAFQRQEFDAAEAGFRQSLELRRHDGPAEFYLRQIKAYRSNPPPPGWVGEVNMDKK